MQTKPLALAAAAALALPLLALPTAQRGNAVSAGDTPEYTFRNAPVNGMGVQSLKDLRGKPVLVEFWGTK